MLNESWFWTLLGIAVVATVYLVVKYRKSSKQEDASDELIEYDREGMGQEFPKSKSKEKEFGTSENHHHRSS